MKDLSQGNLIVSNFFDDSISIVDPVQGKELRRIYLHQKDKAHPPERLGPHHIAIDRRLNHLFVPNTYHSSLEIIDLLTGKAKEVISVGSFPSQVIICKKYNYAYVANSDSNSVSVINMDTLSVALQIPTGELPHGMVMTVDEERIFVANQGARTITEIITSTNEKKKCHTVNGNPWHLKLSYDGNYLYAVHYSHLYDRKGKIYIYSIKEMELLRTLHIGKMPVEVVGDKTNETLYISDSDMNSLHIYSLKNNTMEVSINLSKMPHGVEINHEKNEIYVTGLHDNILHVIDIEKKALVKSIPVGQEPTSIVIL